MNNLNKLGKSPSYPFDKEKRAIPRKTKSGLSLSRLLLPDIELFKVTTGRYDKILEMIGFHRKLGRRFLTHPYYNRDLNKYLFRAWSKLHKFAIENDSERFEALGKILMSRSVAMRMLFVWRVERIWYKKLSIYQIFNVLCKLDDLIKTNSKRFSFKRIFIPKKDKSLRPLAIPPLEWRILKNWVNTYVNVWADGRAIDLKPEQFGILHGGGTAKAIAYAIAKSEESKYVYEFDLSKFFDTIPWRSIKQGLLRYQFPRGIRESIIEYIKWGQAYLANSRFPEWKQYRDKINESIIEDYRGKYEDTDPTKGIILPEPLPEIVRTYEVVSNVVDNIQRVWSEVEQFGRPKQYFDSTVADWGFFAKYISKALIYSLGYGKMKKVLALYDLMDYYHNSALAYARHLFKQHRDKSKESIWFAVRQYYKGTSRSKFLIESGVPQGMGLSPLAACIALSPIYRKYKGKITMYMDDGLLFSNEPIDINRFEKDLANIGVFLSKAKSGYVKWDDNWWKPIKYLGTEYDGTTKILSRIGDPSLTLPTFPSEEEIRKLLKKKTKGENNKIMDSQNLTRETYEDHKIILPASIGSDLNRWVTYDRFEYGLSYLYGSFNPRKEKEAKRINKFSTLAAFNNKLKTYQTATISSRLTGALADMIRTSKNVDSRNFINSKVKLWERIAVSRTKNPRDQQMLS